jgi:hypothetical protein
MSGYMTQRNNNTYADQQRMSAAVGKTVIATNKRVGRLLVCVQPNGTSGTQFDAIKQWLLELGCDNAVFLDGSDSTMLHARGFFRVPPGKAKDRGNTVGLAFYS